MYKKEYSLSGVGSLHDVRVAGQPETRLSDLCRHCSLFALTSILMYAWFVNGAAYYGITLMAADGAG